MFVCVCERESDREREREWERESESGREMRGGARAEVCACARSEGKRENGRSSTVQRKIIRCGQT